MSPHRSSASPGPDAPCPCGSSADYGSCCGPLHRGTAAAPTAERLMRSRFSAFAVGDAAYLLRTWHPRTRPPRLELTRSQHWVRLEILGTENGTPFHTEGTVSFRAVYRLGGREDELREDSRFLRHEGAWTYLDGVVQD